MTEPRAPERHVRVVTSTRAVPRAAAWWSWSLAMVGLAVFVVVLAAGAALPPLLPTLVLVLVLALCIGRVAFYPSELAASGELAVLCCAVVAFRSTAPATGPLLLALLVGPLDLGHWRQRSFVRMAYNSGNRAVAALGAAGAFAAVGALLGSSTGALVAAVVLAAVVATVLDGAATVGLVVCLGGSVPTARRELLDIDALALPLAVVGGAVGFLATGIGWWAAVLPLVAIAFAPELLQARARIPARAVRDAMLAVELVAALAVVAWFSAPPALPTTLVLATLAVLVGVELGVDVRTPLSPTLGIVVVVAAAGVGGRSGVFSGALVGGVATVVAWWCTVRTSRCRSALGVAIAVGAGALAAGVVVHPVDGALAPWVLVAAATGMFTGLAIVVAHTTWRGSLVDQLWVVPLLIAPVAVRVVPVRSSAATTALVAASLLVVAVLGAWCGSTPWRSRLLSSAAVRVAVPGRARVFVGASAAAVAGLGAGVAPLSTDAHVALTWVAIMFGATANVMALWATRQWRLAPRARIRQTLVLGVTAVGWCAVAVLARSGWVVAGGMIGIALALVVACIGVTTVRVADRDLLPLGSPRAT